MFSNRIKRAALARITTNVSKTVSNVLDIEIATVRVKKIEEPTAREHDRRTLGDVHGNNSLQHAHGLAYGTLSIRC